jgi:hypothetical protein
MGRRRIVGTRMATSLRGKKGREGSKVLKVPKQKVDTISLKRSRTISANLLRIQRLNWNHLHLVLG